MDIIVLLIPIAMLFIGLAIWAFFYSVNSGQFDDLEGPAHSILYDDDSHLIPTSKQSKDKDKSNLADD